MQQDYTFTSESYYDRDKDRRNRLTSWSAKVEAGAVPPSRWMRRSCVTSNTWCAKTRSK